MSFKKLNYRLVFILLFATFLRLYNFPLRYNLGVETVRDAVIGIVGAREFQAPLTGAFSSLGPFTFGPWYAYQMIISTILLRTAYAPWIYLTILSIATVFVSYKIGQLLYGKNFGLLLALLVTISPAQIISATHLTSPNMTNIFAVCALYIFLRIILKNGSYWWGYLLGFLIGVGMNLHFQMSGLLVFPLIILLYRPKKYKFFLNAVIGVVTAFLPLIFFELNNHWFNTRNLVYYLLHDRYLIYIPNSWTIYLRDFWPAFWADTFGIPIYFALFLVALFIFSLAQSFRHRKISPILVLILIAFLVNFVNLRYYWGPRFFGYLNFMRPFVFIFTGIGLYTLCRFKYGTLSAAAIVVLIGVFSWERNFETLQKDPFSIRIYEQMATLRKLYPYKKFNIYGCNRLINSGYVSNLYSYIFVLDKDNKLSSGGIPLGVSSSNCKDSVYPILADTGFVNLEGFSKEKLKKEGWGTETFETIYNSSARWWFNLKP